MRRLWIYRLPAAAAKKALMKVYIEDPVYGDTRVGGCMCRLLGELKNDQHKHYNIAFRAARVFVVQDPDNVPAGSCYRLPEGEEDIFLEGKNYRDPKAGNPFRFDGAEEETVEAEEEAAEVAVSEIAAVEEAVPVPEEEPVVEEPVVQEEAEIYEDTQIEEVPVRREEKKVKKEKVSKPKKKGGSKLKVLLVIAILIGIAAGIAAGVFVSSALVKEEQEVAVAQTFRCGDLQITLTDAFAEAEAAGYTACYSAGDTAVFVMREAFEMKEGFGELDLESYGAMIMENNHIPETVNLETKDGLTTFAWVITDEISGIPYYYYCGLYKGVDAFWMVQVTTEAEGAAEEIPMFRQWLQSVVLPE